MSTKTMKNVMALGAGGALVASAIAIATSSPSCAMPVLPNTAAVRTAASSQVIDVRHYRHGYHGYYRRGYYRHGYYGRGYGRGYYGRGYRRGYYGGGYGYPYYGNPYPFGYGWGGW